MTDNARRIIIRRLHIPPIHAEAILAATVMHSADNYYCDLFLGHDCRSVFLAGDFTRFQETLIARNRYTTTKLLRRQHLDDPICKILYMSFYWSVVCRGCTVYRCVQLRCVVDMALLARCVHHTILVLVSIIWYFVLGSVMFLLSSLLGVVFTHAHTQKKKKTTIYEKFK